ncbi:alpha/beta hydrolase [Sphingomonas sp. R1]|uniref:alpha/beta hydrolase n=1 Tax=Sphingomonas sp. R1 TaxID=399176 RepID=UPI002224BFBC|nr:alpha/beta hydrolase [Sphingomonas sp. R1]UYY77227.1 alpha/beta hydrolase [Sphingomonas sp. R1]
MTLATAPLDRFSVISTGTGPARALSALFGTPLRSDAHVDYSEETPRQRSLWAVKLDSAILHAERPVLLVANGASCFAATWWARLSPRDYIARVAGAVLIDPIEGEGDADHFASPKIRLPFPSLLLSGAGPDAGVAARVEALATGWGSAVGGLPQLPHARRSGSHWQGARELVLRMTAGIVERRAQAADALAAALAPDQD